MTSRIQLLHPVSKFNFSQRTIRQYYVCSQHLKSPSCTSNNYIIARNITYNEKIASRGIIDEYGSGFSDAGGLDGFGKFEDMEQFMTDYVPEFITNVVPVLQELSLNNCWPTVIIAHTFNNFQEITGLPWYVTICLISAFIKISLYPFHIWWRKDFQELVKSSPFRMTTFLQTYFENVIKLGSEEAIKHAYSMQESKCKELNFPLFPRLFPLYATTLIPVMATLGIAHLTHLVYEPLFTGGLLWFSNLAETDPYIILPAMNSLIIIANSRLHPFGLLIPKPVFMLGFKGQAAFALLTLSQMWFSTAVLIYWISANSIGFIINLILYNNTVRKYHGLENKVQVFGSLLHHTPVIALLGKEIESKRVQYLELQTAETQLLENENDLKFPK